MSGEFDYTALDDNYRDAFGRKGDDDLIRAGAHVDGIEDIRADSERVRLRAHIIQSMEKSGETHLYDWEHRTLSERESDIRKILEVEDKIHLNRKSPLNVDVREGMDPTTLGVTSRRSDYASIAINADLLRKGSASDNLNIAYHESKHVDQVANDVVAERDVTVYGPGSKEAVVHEELGLNRSVYAIRYAELLIEAEARAAGRNGQLAFQQSLKNTTEGGRDMATIDVDGIIDGKIAGMNKELDGLISLAREQGIGSKQYKESIAAIEQKRREIAGYRQTVNLARQERYIEGQTVARLTKATPGENGKIEDPVLIKDEKAIVSAAKEHGITSAAYREACLRKQQHEQELLRARAGLEKNETVLQRMAVNAMEEKKHV